LRTGCRGLSFIRPARRLRTWRRYAAEKIKKSLVVVSQPNRTVGFSGIRTFCFQARLIEATSQAISSREPSQIHYASVRDYAKLEEKQAFIRGKRLSVT
jgi:hypothetical protein